MTLDTSKRLGGLALASVLLVAACSSGSGATTAPSAAAATAAATAAASAAESMAASPAESAAAAVSGTINVSGSSTVEPISTAIAEAFKAANPDFNYTIEGPGTGDGFKRFCAGETDISDASRKIKDEEAATCAGGRHRVHRAPSRVRRHHRHDQPGRQRDVTCLSLRRPVRADRPRVHRLRQVVRRRGARQGARLEHGLPGHRPAVTGPGEESGTYDCFVELV